MAVETHQPIYECACTDTPILACSATAWRESRGC